MKEKRQFETIEPLFYFGESSKITGKRTKDGEFVVFAGSRICAGKNAVPSLDIQTLRKRYINKFTENGVLKEDILFEPAGLSRAADQAFSFVSGLIHFFGRRGFDTWQTSEGKTLREVCKEDGYPIPYWEQDSN